jgi:hypothetical protein
MKIELLYFDGCPSYEVLLPKLRELLDREGVGDEIELCRIGSLEAAEQARFLGSPTVRVDGQDIEPDTKERSDYGLKCRLYRSNEETSGLPPEAWIVEAIARTSASAASTSTPSRALLTSSTHSILPLSCHRKGHARPANTETLRSSAMPGT